MEKFIKNINEKNFQITKEYTINKIILVPINLWKERQYYLFINKGLFAKTACTKDISKHNCMFLEKNKFGRIKNKKQVISWLKKKK